MCVCVCSHAASLGTGSRGWVMPEPERHAKWRLGKRAKTKDNQSKKLLKDFGNYFFLSNRITFVHMDWETPKSPAQGR